MRNLLVSVTAFLCICSSAFAHQPRLIDGSTQNQILDLQTSQAFYGKLQGRPARFLLANDKPFRLYLQISTPNAPGAHTDWQVILYRYQDGWSYQLPQLKKWTEFWEPFGGDSYLLGAEARLKLGAGLYRLTVSRPGLRGKYVLVVGEQENFGFTQSVKALADLPKLKHDYFGASWFEAYFSRTVPVLAIVLIPWLLLIWWLWHRPKSKE